ncbi:DUF1048 domain-containing protein [Agromyces sp. CFH 90414]|uniref:DUF1048 domain-containing protein n=1 Tax=Agromyces agglutinans TaxID=2662258 RepID=A0A6I2F7X0_9MICO|nr:DUF1048 domain-containing protein [Agromyces agglutinans]
MSATWIDEFAASPDERQEYRRYVARKQHLPVGHRAAVEAIERYLVYRGSITSGEALLRLLDDLADVFEECVAGGIPVRSIVGDDPVAFAELLLDNYVDGQWIAKERARLARAIDAIAAASPSLGSSSSGSPSGASGGA